MSVRAPITVQSDEWATPQWLFDALNAEFGFTLDGAATRGNAKCRDYNTSRCAVGADWSDNRVFCNPPYSNIGSFVESALASGSLAVLLLPVRTDSDWFRALIESNLTTIRFFRRRIAFISNGEAMKSPPFASMVAVVGGGA